MRSGLPWFVQYSSLARAAGAVHQKMQPPLLKQQLLCLQQIRSQLFNSQASSWWCYQQQLLVRTTGTLALHQRAPHCRYTAHAAQSHDLKRYSQTLFDILPSQWTYMGSSSSSTQKHADVPRATSAPPLQGGPSNSRVLLLQQQQMQMQRVHSHAYACISNSTFWADCATMSSSSCRGFSTTSDNTSSAGGHRPKNTKGALPESGPSSKTLRALPFRVTRAAAADAFAQYHVKHWYQSRQRPALAKPFKETFLPFWVGSGLVRVEVTGAEVGHEHLVTRYDRARGRSEPRWETVWSHVKLHLVWDTEVKPEDPEAQLYASWKYPRSDVDVLRPGVLVTAARSITPDMLQASPGAGVETRRVGPFTVDPMAARKLLVTRIETVERRHAEQEISRLTGAQQVRFVEMSCTYLGSTGAARGTAAADGPGGLNLSPVYVPVYVFSWWHGGAKVRTFVSGVEASSVSGVQVLDDMKLASYATLATAGVGAALGLPFNMLVWGALVVPFVTIGLVTRFWPRVYSSLHGLRDWLQSWGKSADSHGVDWNAEFVHAYGAQESRKREQEQQQSYWQDQQHGGAFRAQHPREFFEQFMRDPFSFFEQQFAKQQRQQQQARQQQGYQRQGQRHNQQQQKQQQKQQQQQYSRAGGSTAAGSRCDPLGYYGTLGVQQGCTTQEVQAAFRGLALKHHPDRYSSASDKEKATKKFQTITEAYQVLRDPKKRQLYDSGQYHDRA